MDAESTEDEIHRPSPMRSVLGGPGSIRRWLVGSALVILVAGVLFNYAGFLGRIAIFMIVAVLVITMFRARSLVVGDEDRLRRSLRRQVQETRDAPEPEEDKILLNDEEWERAREALRLRGIDLDDELPPTHVSD